MLHLFIIELSNRLTYNQWIFLLTLHEMAGKAWMSRRTVAERCNTAVKYHSARDPIAMLERMGYIDYKVETKPKKQVMVRITDEGRDYLKTARNLMRAQSQTTITAA
jgi:DNA-binding MarR family transcriptional regulator